MNTLISQKLSPTECRMQGHTAQNQAPESRLLAEQRQPRRVLSHLGLHRNHSRPSAVHCAYVHLPRSHAQSPAFRHEAITHASGWYEPVWRKSPLEDWMEPTSKSVTLCTSLNPPEFYFLKITMRLPGKKILQHLTQCLAHTGVQGIFTISPTYQGAYRVKNRNRGRNVPNISVHMLQGRGNPFLPGPGHPRRVSSGLSSTFVTSISFSAFLFPVRELEWDQEFLCRQAPVRCQALEFGDPDARF